MCERKKLRIYLFLTGWEIDDKGLYACTSWLTDGDIGHKEFNLYVSISDMWIRYHFCLSGGENGCKRLKRAWYAGMQAWYTHILRIEEKKPTD